MLVASEVADDVELSWPADGAVESDWVEEMTAGVMLFLSRRVLSSVSVMHVEPTQRVLFT